MTRILTSKALWFWIIVLTFLFAGAGCLSEDRVPVSHEWVVLPGFDDGVRVDRFVDCEARVLVYRMYQGMAAVPLSETYLKYRDVCPGNSETQLE